MNTYHFGPDIVGYVIVDLCNEALDCEQIDRLIPHFRACTSLTVSTSFITFAGH